MEKVKDLDNDLVFKHSVEYNDQVAYKMIEPKSQTIDRNVLEDVHEVREIICDLVIQKKLDSVDLTIINMKDCSPMPSAKDIAIAIKINVATVFRRLQHIKKLMSKELRLKYG